MEQRDSHCPCARACEPTAKGTGLGAQRGKKTLLSLTLAGRRARDARHSKEGALQASAVRSCALTRPVGSLAGAARPLHSNAGVRRRAQGGRKPPVEHKGRCPPERAACAARGGNAGLAIPGRAWAPGCRKSYHRDNWLVAAERPQRRRFLILRCRLFLAWRCTGRQVLDCSPTNRERELGSDRRETG